MTTSATHDIKMLRSALIGLIGVSKEDDLRQLKRKIREKQTAKAPEKIDAINALLATMHYEHLNGKNRTNRIVMGKMIELTEEEIKSVADSLMAHEFGIDAMCNDDICRIVTAVIDGLCASGIYTEMKFR